MSTTACALKYFYIFRDCRRTASATAHYTAISRATHQLLDGNPKIFTDSLAVGFVPGSSEPEIRAQADELNLPHPRRTRSGVVIRSRFTEEHLHEAVTNGVRQYLILGAGFDTFSYRQPNWMSGLNLFEVDHPATQALKRQYLKEAGITPANNVAFCPIDFENMSLVEGIEQTSFDMNAPTFVSWLGVSMYRNRISTSRTNI